MLRRLFFSALVPAVILAGTSTVRAIDDPRFAAEFVQGLRERGYHDLALQYLDQLRQAADTPADFKRTIPYEEGKTLIEEATRANDPEARKDKLEQAKIKIDAFVKANPDLPETTQALVDLAHLLYERGEAEVDLAGDARNATDKDNKLAAARGYYANAREAYNRAFDRLKSKLAEYPNTKLEGPRQIERERIRDSMMLAELQRAVVDYNEAQTFPLGSPERTDLLTKGLAAFEDIYRRYRAQMAGFTARMWQGKCYEEQGKLGEAMGIYNELLDQSHPALRSLQKQVDYFRIIVMTKRKEYALAADECVRWLNAFPKDRRSYEALGVQFELAKNILAQLPGVSGAERDKAIRVATDHLTDVVRVVSPFKPEAIALLQKYRPNAALSAADISKLNYDDAVAQANQAISTLAYENGISLLKIAIRKADPIRDPAKANSARYMLAYCYIMAKKYYEAAVIAEHVARGYPRDEWASKSADLAMQAMVEGYNTLNQGNRIPDLDRLVALARYTAETWPETEQGDSGRMMMGLVNLGRGQYPDAIAAFESVRSSSSRWIEAQTSCGDAHWKMSLRHRDKGDAKQADAEVQQAIAKLNLSLKARRDANIPDTDLGLISNACDLAEIELEIGKATDALALLEPIAKKLATANRPPSLNVAYSRVVAGILRGHVSTDKVDLAIADMKTIESIGGAGTNAARLYFELGRLLEREMETLQKGKDQRRLNATRQSYEMFLKALVASKANQTFQSLRWAGDNLLKLGAAKDANEVYSTILTTYSTDPEFLKTEGASQQITLVRLKQVSALRTLGNLPEAETMLNDLLEQNKRSIEPRMEKGYLLIAKAEARQGTWIQVYSYWKDLAQKLSNESPKPIQYFESWYQAAFALQKQGNKALARTTLASIIRLSPTLGSPEMKAKYQDLLKQIGK